MEIYIIFSGLFFLYFILLRGGVSELISCKVQKFSSNSMLFKHLFLIFSIFMLIFIMNKSAFTYYQTEKSKISDVEGKKLSFELLYEYFKYTMLIYILFILISNCDTPYIGFVFLFIGIIIFSNIIEDIYTEEDVEKNNKKIKLIRSLKNTLYIIFIITLLIGCFKYYRRLRKEYKSNWSWLRFFENKCNL